MLLTPKLDEGIPDDQIVGWSNTYLVFWHWALLKLLQISQCSIKVWKSFDFEFTGSCHAKKFSSNARTHIVRFLCWEADCSAGNLLSLEICGEEYIDHIILEHMTGYLWQVIMFSINIWLIVFPGDPQEERQKYLNCSLPKGTLGTLGEALHCSKSIETHHIKHHCGPFRRRLQSLDELGDKGYTGTVLQGKAQSMLRIYHCMLPILIIQQGLRLVIMTKLESWKKTFM